MKRIQIKNEGTMLIRHVCKFAALPIKGKFIALIKAKHFCK